MSSRYPFRNVKAKMVAKGLSLLVVAKKAEVSYTMACEILKGRRNDAVRLHRLSVAIDQLEEAPV